MYGKESSTSFMTYLGMRNLLRSSKNGLAEETKVEKGRERDKGQPEAIASPEKVEKEMKKTREASHPEKFKARALDGHHRNCILLLFVGLAQRAPLFVFLFLFK